MGSSEGCLRHVFDVASQDRCFLQPAFSIVFRQASFRRRTGTRNPRPPPPKRFSSPQFYSRTNLAWKSTGTPTMQASYFASNSPQSPLRYIFDLVGQGTPFENIRRSPKFDQNSAFTLDTLHSCICPQNSLSSYKTLQWPHLVNLKRRIFHPGALRLGQYLGRTADRSGESLSSQGVSRFSVMAAFKRTRFWLRRRGGRQTDVSTLCWWW